MMTSQMTTYDNLKA